MGCSEEDKYLKNQVVLGFFHLWNPGMVYAWWHSEYHSFMFKIKNGIKKKQLKKYILSFSSSLPPLIFVPLPLLILCLLKASAEPQSGDCS